MVSYRVYEAFSDLPGVQVIGVKSRKGDQDGLGSRCHVPLVLCDCLYEDTSMVVIVSQPSLSKIGSLAYDSLQAFIGLLRKIISWFKMVVIVHGGLHPRVCATPALHQPGASLGGGGGGIIAVHTQASMMVGITHAPDGNAQLAAALYSRMLELQDIPAYCLVPSVINVISGLSRKRPSAEACLGYAYRFASKTVCLRHQLASI